MLPFEGGRLYHKGDSSMILRRTFIVVQVLTAILHFQTQSVDAAVPSNLHRNSRGSSQCSLHCNPSTKWLYQVGKVYTYDYSVESSTFMAGTSNQKSMTRLTAKAKISVKTPCEYILWLEDVALSGSSGDEFAEQLSRNSLTFEFSDGRIPTVCEASDDPTWVVNIKKGVLSAFQQGIEDFEAKETIDEVDVVGECETNYIPMGSSHTRQTLKKVKNMKTCKNNQKLFQFALNLPDVNIQQLAMVDSSHECDLVISDAKLHRAECFENHMFKPFSNGENGATTTQTQSLALVGEEFGELPESDHFLRSSLLFKHKDTPEEASTEEALSEMLAKFPKLPESERPELFGTIVHALRRFRYPQLVKIFYNIKDIEVRRFILDAIPTLKTDAGVRLMKDIVQSGIISEATMDSWFSSLAFYKNPTRGMISSLAIFLDEAVPRQSALLGISALVNTFCQADMDCASLPEIVEIIQKFEHLLRSNCMATGQEEEDTVILSLKGLRNIGHLQDSGPVLVRCYEEFTNAMDIRLAALDTIRKMSCSTNDFDQKLMKTFSEISNDSELRIGAYLALMECPNEDTMKTVKAVLMSEPVNQVGSFVWTHLTNLQETTSTSPYKIALKHLIGNTFLQNKWNTDARKFSRYFETSYYSDQLRLGGTVDGSLIFSHESYIPRSGMLNLTINMFGENINLFELGARVEGFENLVENTFGPDGYFREDTFYKLLQSFRQKRDTDQVISDFQQTYNNGRVEDPRGRMYLRMFGREIHFASFDGLNDLLRTSSWWPSSMFGFTFDKEIDYAKSTMFLDGSIVIPTAAGFPLKMKVEGSSSLKLKSSTQVDIADLLTLGRANIQAKVYPTATIEITGEMSVDAIHAKTGLRSVTKLHSSTFLDGLFQMDGRRLVKAQINMPKDAIEVLEASVDFLSYQNDHFVALETKTTGVEYNGCSPSAINDVMGVKICGQAMYHEIGGKGKSSYYFAGPSHLRIGVQKTDVFDKYVFAYVWEREADEHHLHVTFDTPGSRINRLTGAEVKFNDDFSKFGLDLYSPVHEVKALVRYEWGVEKKLLKGSLIADNSNVIAMTNSLTTESDGFYELQSKLTYYDRVIIDYDGNLRWQSHKASLNAKLEGAFHDRIHVTGYVHLSNDRYNVGGKVVSSPLMLDVTGQVYPTDTSLAVKADLLYRIFGSEQSVVKIDGSYELSEHGKLNKHAMHLSLNPLSSPNWNTEITWETLISSDYLENNGKVRVGKDSWEVQQLFSSQATESLQELLVKLGIANKENGNEYKIDFQHQVLPTSSKNKIGLSLSPTLHFEAYLNHEKSSSPIHHAFQGGLTYPGRTIALGAELKEQANDDFVGNAFFQWSSSHRASLDVSFRRGNTANIDYLVSATLVVPEMEKFSINGVLLLDPRRSVANLEWSFGADHFLTEIEYMPVDLEHRINGRLLMNGEVYTGVMTVRNDVFKEIHIDFKTKRHFVLDFVSSHNYQDTTFEVFWDKDNDMSKHVSVQVKITPSTIDASIQALENEAKFNGRYDSNSFHAKGIWNDQLAKIEGRLMAESGQYAAEFKLASSCELVKDVRLIAKHAMHNKAGGAIMIDSMVQIVWNEVHHTLTLTGEKSDNIQGRLALESTYQILNNFSIQLDHSRTGTNIQTSVMAAYQGSEITVNFSHNGGKIKEGQLVIKTPFEIMESLDVAYRLKFGRDIYANMKIYHNDKNKINFEMKGHFRKKTDFSFGCDIDHTFGEPISVAFKFKKEIDSLAVGTKAKYGDIGSTMMVSLSKENGYLAKVDFDLACPEYPTSFDLAFAKTDDFKLKTSLIFRGSQVLDVDLFLKNNPGDFKISGDASIFTHRFVTDIERSNVYSNNQYNVTKLIDFEYTRSGVTHSEILLRSIKVHEETGYTLDMTGTLNSPLVGRTAVAFYDYMIHSSGKREAKLSLKVGAKESNLWFNQEQSSESSMHSVRLITPYEAIKSASAVVSQNFVSEKYLCDVLTKWNQDIYKLQLTHFSEGSVNTINTKFVGPWGESTLNGKYQEFDDKSPNDGFKAEVLFIDPSEMEFVSKLELKKTASMLNFIGSLNTPLTEELTIVAQVDFTDQLAGVRGELKGGNELLLNAEALYLVEEPVRKMTASLAAPMFGLVDHKASGSLTTESCSGEVMVALEKAGSTKRIDLLAKVSNCKVGPEAKLQITSPFEGYRTVSFFAIADIFGESDKRLEVDMSKETSKLSAKVSYADNDVEMKGQVHVESPFKSVKTFDLNGQYLKAVKQWELKYNRNEFDLGTSGKWDKSLTGFGIEGKLFTSSQDWKEMEFKGKVDLGSDSKSIQVSGSSDDKTHTLAISGKIKEGKGSASTSVEMPVFGLKGVTIDLNYEYNTGGGEAMLDLCGNKYEVKWDVDPNGIEGYAKTPIEHLNDVKFQMLLVNNPSKKSVDFFLSRNDDVYSADATIDLQHFSAVVHVSTPWQIVKKAKMELRLSNGRERQAEALFELNRHFLQLNLLLSRDFYHSQGDFIVKLPKLEVPDIVVKVGHDFRSSPSTVFVHSIVNAKNYLVLEGNLSKERFNAMFETPCTGVNDVAANWDVSEQSGRINLKATSHSEVALEGSVEYESKPDIAEIRTTFTSEILPFRVCSTVFSYDMSQKLRKVSLISKLDSQFLELKSTFVLTEDSFDGNIAMKSSSKEYTDIKVRGKYNISVRPEASVTIERNGVAKTVRIRVSFDNVIPTVYITTPFEGYEKLVFRGNFNSKDNKIYLDLILERNDEKFMVISNKVSYDDDLTHLDISSDVITPFSGWENVQVQAVWKQEEPYIVKFKVTKNGEMYAVSGQVSFKRKQFNLDFVSPIEDYEFLSLSGKFGTTSIGKSLGISFGNKKVRRDVAFTYGLDKGRAMMQVDLPFEGVKRLKFSSAMQADSPTHGLDFDFEIGGEKDFGFGVKYEFSENYKDGNVLVKLTELYTPSFKLPAYEMSLVYSNIDLNLDNGFKTKFHIKSSTGGVLFSGEVDNSLLEKGITTLSVRSIFPGFTKIDIAFNVPPESLRSWDGPKDGQEIGSLLFEIEDKIYSFSVTFVNGKEHLIVLKTPYDGYEKVEVTLVDNINGEYSVTVVRNDEIISTIDVHHSLKWKTYFDLTGKFEVKWKAMKKIWADFSAEFEEGIRGRIELNNLFKLAYSIIDQGGETATKFSMKLNDKFLTYSSKQQRKDDDNTKTGFIRSSSETKSNIEFLGSKISTTKYEIKYKPGSYSARYETTSDGKTDIILDGKLNFAENEFDFSLILDSDHDIDILKDNFGKDGFLPLKISLKFETDKVSFAKITGQFARRRIVIKLEKTDGSVEVEVSTNFSQFESFKGKANWSNNQKFLSDASFEMNGQVLLEGTLQFDCDPFTLAKISLSVPESWTQELEIRWNVGLRGEKYNLQLIAGGPIEMKLDVTFVKGKQAGKIEMSFNMDTMIANGLSLDYLSEIEYSYGQNNLLRVKCVNKAESRTWEIKANLDLKESGHIATGEIKLLTPILPEVNILLDWDFYNNKKSLDSKLTFPLVPNGEELVECQFKFDINWTPEKSAIDVYVSALDMAAQFIGRRDSYKSINYVLKLNEMHFEFDNKNDVQSAESFDISLDLKIPVLECSPFRMKLSAVNEEGPVKKVGVIGDVLFCGKGKATLNFAYDYNGLFLLKIDSPFTSVPIILERKISTFPGLDREVALTQLQLQTMDKDYSASIYEDYTFPGEHWLDLHILIESKTNGKFFRLVSTVFYDGVISMQIAEKIDVRLQILNIQSFSLDIISKSISFIPAGSATMKLLNDQENVFKIAVKNAEGKDQLLLDISATLDSDGGQFLTTFSTPYGPVQNVELDVKAKLNEKEKSTTASLKYNKDTFEMKAEWDLEEQEIDFEAATSMNDKRIDFDLEYGSNIDAKFSYGEFSASMTVKSSEEASSSFQLLVNAMGKKYELSGTHQMPFRNTVNINLDGQTVSMIAEVNENDQGILITIKSSFESFKEVTLTGKLDLTKSRLEVHGTGNINAIDYKFDMIMNAADKHSTFGTWTVSAGVKYITFTGRNEQTSPTNQETTFSLESSEFGPMKAKLQYAFTSSGVKGILDISTPFQNYGLDLIHLDFDGQYKPGSLVSLKAKASVRKELIFNVDSTLSYGDLADLSIRMIAEIPILNENEFRFGLTFKAKSWNNLGFGIELFLFGRPHKVEFMYEIVGTDLEGILQLKLDWIEPTDIINLPFTGTYLLEDTMALIKFHIAGTGLTYEMNLQTNEIYSLLTISNKLVAQYIYDGFHPIDVELKVNPEKSASLQIRKSINKSDTSSKIVVMNLRFDFFDKKIEGTIDINVEGFKKSISIDIELGPRGKFEVSMGGIRHSVGLEMQSDQGYKAKAFLNSPTFGDFELDLDQDIYSGTLLLSTTKGIHKISYDVQERNGYEVTLQLETPYLKEGQAVCKLNIDTDSDTYKARITFNNEHFVSGTVELLKHGFAASSNLQTPLLSKRLGFDVNFENRIDEIIGTLAVTFGEKHAVQFEFDKIGQIGTMRAQSSIIPHESLEIKGGYIRTGSNYHLEMTIQLRKEMLQVEGDFVFNSPLNFSGILSYHGSSLWLTKAKANFKFAWDQEHMVAFDVSTSDMRFSRFKVDATFDETAKEGVASVEVLTPFDSLKHLGMKMTAEQPYFGRKQNMAVSVVLPLGEYHGTVGWNVDEDQLANLNLSGPNGQILDTVVYFQRKSSDSSLKMELSTGLVCFKDVEVIIKFPNVIGREGTFSGDVDINDVKWYSTVMYQLKENRKEVSVKIETPIQGHANYGLEVAYENSERKTIKLFAEGMNVTMGIKLDYMFNSLRDFVVQAEIDSPFQSFPLVDFHIANRMTPETLKTTLKGLWKDNRFNVDMAYSGDLDGNYEGEATMTWNEHGVKTEGAIHLNDLTAQTIIVADVPLGKMEIDIDASVQDGFPIQSSLRINDKRYLKVHHKNRKGALEISGFSTDFVVNFHHDASIDVSTSLSRTDSPLRGNSSFHLVARQSEVGGDFSLSSSWSSGQTYRMSGKYDPRPGRLMTSGFLYADDVRLFGLDMFKTSGSGEAYRKLELSLPRYTVVYDSTCSHSEENSSTMIANLKWAETGAPIMRGIGFLLERDQNEFLFTLRRPIGERFDDDHAITIVHKVEEGARTVEVKVDHPQEELQMFAKCKLSHVCSPLESQGNAEIVYKIGTHPFKYLDGVIQVDKANRAMEATVRIDGKLLSAKGSLLIGSTEKVAFLSLLNNDGAFLTAEATAKPSVPSFDITARAKDANVDFFAGLAEDDLMLMRLSHDNVDDVKVQLQLTAESELVLESYLRPDLWKDAQKEFDRRIVEFASHPEFSFEEVQEVISILHEVNKEVFGDISNLLDYQTEFILHATKKIANVLKHCYKENILLCRDLVDYFADVLRSIGHWSSLILREVLATGHSLNLSFNDLTEGYFLFLDEQLRLFQVFVNEAYEKTCKYLVSLDLNLDVLSDDIKELIANVGQNVEHLMGMYKRFVRKYTQKISHIVDSLTLRVKDDVKRFLSQATFYLKQFRFIQEVLSFYRDYQSWLEELHFSQHLEETLGEFNVYIEEATSEVENWRQMALRYISDVQSFLSSRYATLSRYPPVAYLVSFGQRFIALVNSILEQFSFENSLRTFATHAFGRVNAVTSTAIKVLDAIYNGKRSYSVEYDANKGYIRLAQALPFHWNSFRETPDVVALFKADESLNDYNDFDFTEFYHELLEVMNTVSRAVNTRTLVPPFAATAMIAGDSMFMTFDKKFYEFIAGDCSYLLTNDFLHNRFSVVANFVGGKRSSLTVESDGTLIDIDTKDLKVTLDHRSVELPVVFDHTYIRREGQRIILENSEGIKLQCNAVHDVCTFTVSGWYFGKTGGLLGIYDNEPSNDWMTPDREVLFDVSAFATSWAVGGACQTPRGPAFFSSGANLHERQTCEDLFLSDASALMPCFKTVDPRPFFKQCLARMQSVKNEQIKSSGFCPTAAAYIETCRQRGVEVWMPSPCVRCALHGDDVTVRSGESVSYQSNAPRSADVVFVVEQHACMNQFRLRDLPVFIDLMLDERNMVDNKFALIGFGGRDQLEPPHVHTVGSKIFGDRTQMAKALAENIVTPGHKGDVFAALQFAARQTFRPGVSKTIVLATCSPAEDGSFFGDAMTMLSEHDIVVHHLSAPLGDLSFKGRGKTTSSKMYGFDRASVFTVRNVNADEGDSDLRRQLRVPKDFVSTLAMESGGTVFPLSKLDKRKQTTAKKVGTAVSRQVAVRAEPSDCQVCDCLAHFDGMGELQCQKCIRPAIDIILNTWAEGA